ncbi:MAG TPA: DUF1194 domain-containing protein [Bauldia sp.]|nr:DUF1194 domain-containing protein [Bauldia sp.]
MTRLLAATIVLTALASVVAAGRPDQAPETRWAAADGAVTEVDLELVLAIDVSGSMSAVEQAKQREGYASAFQHPDVLAAIESGPLGRIAVAYVAWAGPDEQEQILPWSIIANDEDAAHFSAAIAASELGFPRQVGPWRTGTSISAALDFAARLFEKNGLTAPRRAIDISGDGPNNSGVPVLVARAAVIAQGIVINGLPLRLGKSITLPVDDYYDRCVIGGPGAFSISVNDPAEFGIAIRRKLVLEIADSRSSFAIADLYSISITQPPEFCDRWHPAQP